MMNPSRNNRPNDIDDDFFDDDDFLALDGDEEHDTLEDVVESDYKDVIERGENSTFQKLVDIDENAGKRGYMKLRHYLTESLITQRLSGCEFSIVLLLLRMTEGYGLKETYFANSFIQDKTGYDKNHISTSMKKLRERNIIERTREAKYGMPAYYRVNDHTLSWREI
jgi:phage replication O-like protein O